LGTYKAILKGFLTWVLVPDEFPTKTPRVVKIFKRVESRGFYDGF